MIDWIINALPCAFAAYFFWKAVTSYLDIRRDRAVRKEKRT